MPILSIWKFLVLITSATFCAQYIEDISFYITISRKADLQGFMGFVFEKALTEKMGSQALDEANIGINNVKKNVCERGQSSSLNVDR